MGFAMRHGVPFYEAMGLFTLFSAFCFGVFIYESTRVWHRYGFSFDSPPTACHTGYGTMKMTMHIDEKVLAEVMEVFGFETKTDAVNTALKEMIRKRKLREMMKSGMGLKKGEYAGGLVPGYDPLALRAAEMPKDPDGKD
jgi:hypothetical protein